VGASHAGAVAESATSSLPRMLSVAFDVCLLFLWHVLQSTEWLLVYQDCQEVNTAAATNRTTYGKEFTLGESRERRVNRVARPLSIVEVKHSVVSWFLANVIATEAQMEYMLLIVTIILPGHLTQEEIYLFDKNLFECRRLFPQKADIATTPQNHRWTQSLIRWR
jgi:hypothetical protein